MKQRIAILVLLCIASPAWAQPKEPPSIRFPMPTAAILPITKLNASIFYVIDSDNPIVVDSSPRGLVTITEEAGPIKVRGVFADGNGKVETRTYKGKSVFFVEALATGKCEILVFPQGATKSSDVIHKMLDVDAGSDPRPPPIDPPNKIAAHVTFLGAEKTPEALKTNNDTVLRKWFKDNGIKVHVLDAGDPAIEASGFKPALDKAGGFPAWVLQDDTANVIGQGRMTTSDAMKKSVTPYLGQ